MTQSQPSAAAVAPLLLELARAIRAKRFYAPSDPALHDAMQRVTRVWRGALDRAEELRVDIDASGFALPLGGVVQGPGLDSLARELTQRGVQRLRFHPSLEPRELSLLVDALASEPAAQTAAGGLEYRLRSEGVRHITTTEKPFPGTGPAAAARPRDPVASDRGASSARGPGEPASEATVELLQQLKGLEQCDDVGEYRLTANRVESTLNRLLLAKNLIDAYRAALLFSRHASEASGRASEIRLEATEHLRLATRSEEMMDFVMERADSGTGLTSVQAIQVLCGLGPDAVPQLLARHRRAKPDSRKQTISILIAMGDAALPAVVEELYCGATERALAAVRMLGDMQNPGALRALAEQLDHSEATVRREVVKSLARIGSEQASQALVPKLNGDPELAASVAASLSQCADRTAIRGLIDAAAERGGRAEAVRKEAIRSLGRIGRPEALPTLREVLDRKAMFGRAQNRNLRAAAAQAIGQIGGKQAFLALSEHTDRGDPEVRRACRDAIARLRKAAG